MNTPLDDALESAVTEEAVTTPEEPQEEVSEAQDEAVTEEPEEGEQANAETDKEESFTTVDPNSLPEDLKGIYKSLQADYTRKRQAESKLVKDLQRRIQELEQGTGEEEGFDPDQPMTPDQIKEIAKREFQEQQEAAWIEQAQSEFTTVDERLNENDPLKFNKFLDIVVREELENAVEQYASEKGTVIGFDYKGTAKQLVKEWDQYIENLNKSYVQRQTTLAKENASKLKKSAPVTSPSKGKATERKLSIDDAISEAFSGE